MTPRVHPENAASVAAAVHRLAVLLHAGVTPERAWEHLAAGGDGTAIAVVAAIEHGGDPATAMRERGPMWEPVAIAWRVATTVGAPLAASLRSVADALRDAEQARDDVRVALAEPAATARLVAWLPLVAIGMVAAFGFDITAVLATPTGLVLLLSGGALIVVAHRWTRALVRRAQPPTRIAGLEHEVVAVALSGGVSVDRALEVVVAAGAVDAVAATRGVLDLSRASGAPAVELLRAEADDERRAMRVEGRLRAARLSSRLLIPLGVCTLPAFLLLGVAPMFLSIVTTGPALL